MALVDALKADTLALTAFEVGLFAWMAVMYFLFVPHPKKGPDGAPYKNNPLFKDKTVLLVDDICTEGNSFEAGRAFIGATGAKVICLSWLKTINRSYNAVVGQVPITDPYAQVQLAKKVPVVGFPYGSAILDPKATTDLAELHKTYFDWKWPSDL
jgi:hypoxanthine phosphoribosyltransferase